MHTEAVTPSLELDGISKAFPGVVALDDVSLQLLPGEVHALMGENGAGKSTLIKIMAGVYPRDSGAIRMGGHDLKLSAPRDALGAGIKVVFQEIALIQEFTVAENIFLERYPLKFGGRINWTQLQKDAKALFDKIGFAVDPAARTGDLPVGQQQMVEIARALAHKARVVVMDEPTSSLTPHEVELLFEVIRRLKGLGISIVYVSHKIDEIFVIADRVTVLRDGRHVSTKAIAEHTPDSLVKDMIGRRLGALFPRSREGMVGDAILEVRNVSTASKLRDVSFQARQGEIVGFFGLMGAGRTELAKAVAGFDPITRGQITIGGAALSPHDTSRAVDLGIGLLTEDRKGEGLMLELPVRPNMSLASLGKISRSGFINEAEERKTAKNFIDRFRIRTPSQEQTVKLLSGGNQQKVLIARWLMRGLKVLVVDEPTRGIDVGAKSEIFALLDSLAKEGLAIVMMTSEMPELLGLSDRILVMSGGRITRELSRSEATQEAIFNAAIL